MKINYKSFRFRSLGKQAKKTVIALAALGLGVFGSQAYGQYLSEGFEGGIPAGWTQEYVTGSTDWVQANENGSGSVTPRTGNYMARFLVSSTGPTTKLITPSLDLSSVLNPELTFYFTNEEWYGFDDIDELRLYYKTSAGGSWTQFGATYTAEFATWEEVVVTLPNPSADYYIAFEATSNYARGVTLDDISVDNGATCPKVTSLSISALASTTANITWVAGSSETTWNVSWGLPGFTPGVDEISSTTVSGTAAYQITSLNPSTAYEYKVQADCGGGDESNWVSSTFTTNCSAANVPFFEGFENGYIEDDAIAGCWSQENEIWTANSTWTTYNRTPRTGSFNATLEYGEEDWLFYPVNLTQNVIYEFSVWARQDATSGANLTLAYGTVNSAAGMTNIVVNNQAITNGNYQEVKGYLAPSSTGVYYIGIKGTTGYTPWYLSIDDISLDLAPTCFPVTNLVVDSVSTDGISVSWTAGMTNETAWNISWGAPGYTPGDANEVGTSSATVENSEATSLQDNTTYDIYVQADCGATDGVSTWVMVSGTTDCSYATVPYTQDFESAAAPALPNCATLETINGNDWKTSTSSVTGMTGNKLVYNYNFSQAANTWYYTQGIMLEANQTYSLTYKYSSFNYNEKLKVAIGSNPIATSMTTQLSDLPSITNSSALIDTVEFSVPTTGVYYLGFNAYSDANMNVLYVDDIHVDFCSLTPGTDGSQTICRLDNTIDLNTVITSDYTHGTWNFDAVPSALNGSTLDFSNLIAGTYEADYVVTSACMSDTTTATITVVDAANAGQDGTLDVCMHQPINLFGGLTGSVDMGGKWFDNDGNEITTSNPKAPNVGGTYTYTYKVDNGVCAPATAEVVVTVDGNCDFLAVGNLNMENVHVYPNPASTQVNITADNLSDLFTAYEIVDLTGRTVSKAAVNANEVIVNVDELTNGMYFVNLIGAQNATVKIEVRH